MICSANLDQTEQKLRIFTLVARVGTGPTGCIGDWDVRSLKVVVDLLSVWGKIA